MEEFEEFEECRSEVTKDYVVDAYGDVYDENRLFFCKWIVLTEEEKRIVKSNPFSAKQRG